MTDFSLRAAKGSFCSPLTDERRAGELLFWIIKAARNATAVSWSDIYLMRENIDFVFLIEKKKPQECVYADVKLF